MGLFNRKTKKNRTLTRQPEDEKDREELQRQLAGEYSAGRLATAEYNSMLEAAKSRLTQAQVKTALQAVGTTGGLVSAMATIAGVAITASPAPGNNGPLDIADNGESRFAEDRYVDGEYGHDGDGGDSDAHHDANDGFDDGGGGDDC